jgi:hypothetical protein
MQGLLPRRRRLAGKAAVEAVGVAAGCRATGRALSASFCVVAVPPTSRAHGRTVRKPTPATAATGLRRPPHKQKHRSRLWRPVAAVAAFCVPTTPAAPGTPPRLAGRSRQTAALAAAAFEAASPSLSIWGGVGVPEPQLAALCAGARPRAGTPRPETRPWAHGARCRLATAVRRTPRGPHTSGGGGPAVAAAIPALGAPGPTGDSNPQGGRGKSGNAFGGECRHSRRPGTARHQRDIQTTRLRPWQLAPHWQQASSNRQQQTVGPTATAPRATNGPRSLEHSGPPATAATRRPPALRPAAATKATGFCRVSWVFFL